MQRADSGKANAKAIITLAILAAAGYITVKALPVYVHAYELQDHLHELVIQAMAGQHPSAESVRNNVLAKAQDLELPVKPDNVKVVYTTGKITIHLDYTVPVDLIIFVLNLHFTPSADNLSLT